MSELALESVSIYVTHNTYIHIIAMDFIGFVPLAHFKRYKFNFKRFDAK